MKKPKENKLKILFIILAFAFTIPSIAYLINNKTVFQFDKYYLFFLNDVDRRIQMITFMLLLIAITIVYLLILRKQNKLFKDIKQILIFVIIATIVFSFILPFTSSDVYYYMGTGELESKYGQNPYYVSMLDYIEDNQQKVQNDEILLNGANHWAEQKIVYGPIWPLICKIITEISMGNIDFCLILFKIVNVLLHILNCYLIYKITKKKKFVLIYGLNPFILFEAIANVHNDILVVTLLLTSLYFLLKKKNILLAVIALAISAAVKYFTILLLPFIIIYHFRKEKPGKRLKQCIKYGLIFALVFTLTYVLYFRDFEVLQGILTQQTKSAKSIFLFIYMRYENIANTLMVSAMLSFLIVYATVCIDMLKMKKIKFIKIMKKYNVLLWAFIFILITNFQPWYIMWLFPTIMWQKPKMIKEIIGISILSQIANGVFMIKGEGFENGIPFITMFISGAMLIALFEHILTKTSCKSK